MPHVFTANLMLNAVDETKLIVIFFSSIDVKDLISTLADSHGDCSIFGSYKMDTADSICPSRVRAMLALYKRLEEE